MSVSQPTPWWAWFLGLVFAAPWIALSVWFWRRDLDGESAPPASLAELARRRLAGGR